jgi:Fe-Mn family superoxide dismutase
MQFTLTPLPYAYGALEPYLDARTLEIHHGKHHQAYVDNLNKLIAGTELENLTLEEIVKKADGPVFNNAAQVFNHTFYFNCLAPNAGGEPVGEIIEAINKNFNSFLEFKEKFSTAAKTLFGSGWVWLLKKSGGILEITPSGNAGNPLRDGNTPLLCIDIWEHAYYLKYQNRRPEYIDAFFNVINWAKVNELLK